MLQSDLTQLRLEWWWGFSCKVMGLKTRVAKFDPKVGSLRTTKMKNLVVLVIILVVLILLPYYYVCGTSSHTAVFVGKRKIT